jgi:indole-3-glycerol phosphate synthase/phosphoribosylanthranilate isomerase
MFTEFTEEQKQLLKYTDSFMIGLTQEFIDEYRRLLFNGKEHLPSKEEYSNFAAELQSRSHMHEDDLKFIENLPKQNSYFVGVFADNTAQEVEWALANYNLDILQFHGAETEHFMRAFEGRAKIWRAVCLDEKTEILTQPDWVDLVLLDGKNAGSGQVGDILAMRKIADGLRKFGVAGGINGRTFKHFTQNFSDAAVFDMASGVESEGRFDRMKLDLILQDYERFNTK